MDPQGEYGPKGQDQDDFMNLLDTRPLQEAGATLTPQAILARSAPSAAGSPNIQSVSPASMFSPMTQNAGMNTGSPPQVIGVAATPQDMFNYQAAPMQTTGPSQASAPVQAAGHTISQAPTPQTILNTSGVVPEGQGSANTGSSNSVFADRAGMFAALQQRQQQQQRYKLQTLQQSQAGAGTPSDGQQNSNAFAAQSSQMTQTAAPTQVSPAATSPHMQQQQIIQNLDPETQARVRGELNNKQYELFMKSLLESCKRRGAPLHALPEIRGRRVNLFILYAMVQKLGGGESVTRFQQWSMLAQKLQFPDDCSQQLTAVYYHILLPYEKYLTSPEGMKENQSKRLFLQQFFQELLRKLSGPRVTSGSQNESAISTLISTGAANNDQAFHNKNAAAKKPRKPRAKKKTKKELETEQQTQWGANEASGPDQYLRQQKQKQLALQQAQLRQMQQQQAQLPHDQIQQGMHANSPKVPKVYKRSFARNYVPMRRPIETSNGYDIRAISQVGEKIDANKPIFLYAPELGTVNLHALTLCLQAGRVSEVNVALNTLLVLSADGVIKIPLNQSEAFVDAIASLGSKILNELCTQGGNNSNYNSDEYLENYNVPALIESPTSYSLNDTLTDTVFASQNDQKDMCNEIKIIVDSLTGEDMEQAKSPGSQADADLMDKSIYETTPHPVELSVEKWDFLDQPLRFATPLEECKLSLPSYLKSLRSVRDEVGDIFTKVTTRGAESRVVLLVDQLSTISMVIRNLSFSETNSSILASNLSLKRFISDLLWAVFLQSDKLVFHRKCLNFKKDLIILMTNIAHLFRVDTMVDSCLLLFLVLSFGEAKNVMCDQSHLTFPEYSVSMSKYQGFGADVLAKILSLGFPNRYFIRSLLLNQLETESDPQDVKICQKLLKFYAEKSSHTNHDYKLLNDMFSLLISTIPVQQLNNTPTLVEEIGPTISQSMTALLSLVSFIEKGEWAPTGPNLPLEWLTSEEYAGSSLRRLSEALSNVGIHTSNNLKHLKLLFNSVSAKALQLIKVLVQKSIELCEKDEDGQKSVDSESIKEIVSIPNFLPSESTTFSLLTNPLADVSIVREMNSLYELRNDLLCRFDG
ncbi:LAMI_0H05116g1_1 [Lachancea mirantina]|uniref:LAMI_0H05116g1_1 n=1 Tax=Lachancea mirantina TaxID=1230905 RepID=A0A1G4KET5_9SACH|nr:LAMI_0H05116g1_1 [Lachancea mirantina]